MTKLEPLPAFDTNEQPKEAEDDLPILLTEGEPIGDSVFTHSALEDPTHPNADRALDDLAPPPSIVVTEIATVAERTLPLRVHKARLQDARNIFDLVNSLSHDGTLLRRSYAEICENIRDFTVVELPDPTQSGEPAEFLGCGALHLYGPHLAEVRSIVLHPHARGKGAGAALLHSLLAESDEHGVATTSLFTRLPDFFARFGFRVAERTAMPDKIYKDCQACPRLYACDEVAMVKGPLPNMAVLGQAISIPLPKLVQVELLSTGTSQ